MRPIARPVRIVYTIDLAMIDFVPRPPLSLSNILAAPLAKFFAKLTQTWPRTFQQASCCRANAPATATPCIRRTWWAWTTRYTCLTRWTAWTESGRTPAGWRGGCHRRPRSWFWSWFSWLAPWVSAARRADAVPTAQGDAPQALGVYLIHHPIAHVRIQVDAPFKPNRVSGQKPEAGTRWSRIQSVNWSSDTPPEAIPINILYFSSAEADSS